MEKKEGYFLAVFRASQLFTAFKLTLFISVEVYKNVSKSSCIRHEPMTFPYKLHLIPLEFYWQSIMLSE